VKEVYIGFIRLKFICFISSIINTTIWIVKNVHKQDLIIVYNFTVSTAIPVILTKLIFRYHLIIEFEEFCGYHGGRIHRYQNFFELIGIGIASGFITCSSEIRKKIISIRSDNPPIVMSYGYQQDNLLQHVLHGDQNIPPLTNKLQLLYSGTLDKERGILDIIQLMSFVEDIADLIITGKGPLEEYVERISSLRSNVHYLGYLSESQYYELLHKVHVCVISSPSSQAYSKYSFPSKLTIYLSFGMIVLSTKMDVLLNSPFKDMILFYDENDPASFRSSLANIQDRLNTIPIKSYNIQKISLNERKEICSLLKKYI
jgi:glycosyltransferase involved in cell wall biosynthesis